MSTGCWRVIDYSLYPPLSHSSVLCDMDLNWYPSKYDELADCSGKVAVFAKLVHKKWWRGNILTNNLQNYFPPKWEGVSISDVVILNLNNQFQEMIEMLDNIIDGFVHVKSYGQTLSFDDFPDVLGFPWSEKDEQLVSFLRKHTLVYRIDSENDIYVIPEFPKDGIQNSVAVSSTATRALEDRYQQTRGRNHLYADIELETQRSTKTCTEFLLDGPPLLSNLQSVKLLCVSYLVVPAKVEPDENLSFGAEVLPVLQTLTITELDFPSKVSAFCHVLLRSSLASSLCCIRIWCSTLEGSYSFSLLDDTLSQLPDHVQIEIEEERWENLSKSMSKGVLVAYSCNENKKTFW
ncbi:hypothetical protein ABKN59_009691 [Abortiporus biennis]